MMRNPPDPFCATGNPWANFVHLPHAPATNSLLMAMNGDATLSAKERELALFALQEQREPSVVAFMRAAFPKAAARSATHHVIALYLLDASPEEQQAITAELGTGDAALDSGILITLMNGRDVKPTAKTIELVRAFAARESTREGDKTSALQFLARVDPGSTVAAALRSKNARQIDAVASRLDESISTDDLIEGLASAGNYGRDYLESHLALRLRELTRKNQSSPLADEWAGASPRPGLLRAPLTAYVLGTQLEASGKTELAKKLYLAGRAANAKLLDEPHPYGPPRELVAVELAFRAQLATLALKQKNGAEGRELAKNILEAFRDNHDAFDVLDNFCAGSRPDVVRLEAALAKVK